MAVDLSRLNAPQREAVRHVDGPLLVLAGAGTGKTTVITCRIAWMIEQGIAPANILAVTFTNKAAREMKDRLLAMLPQADPAELTVSTFHSFCCRVLRRQIHRLGLNHNFGIADESDMIDIVREVVAAERLNEEERGVPYFLNRISHAKNYLIEIEALQSSDDPWEQKTARVFRGYRERLRLMNLVDFDDLLVYTVQLWREHAGVLAEYQERYTYLLVDEFQDTNVAQAELLRLLAGKRRNLCVVGDDDQSIYAWRGAEISNILDFPKDYPGAKVVRLEDNYRSMGAILEAANYVIARNELRHGKNLRSGRGAGDVPVLLHAADQAKEAEMVARLVKRYQVEDQIPYHDMAILYRSNQMSRSFETVFTRERIPYRVVGGKEFFERREIKDAAAYLRIIANPANELSLRRILNVPPRGIGIGTMERLQQQARQNRQSLLAAARDEEILNDLPAKTATALRQFADAYQNAFRELSQAGGLAPKIRAYLKEVGYVDGLKGIYRNHNEALERLANVQEFISAASEFENRYGPSSLLDFLEANSLADEQDRIREEEERENLGVNLMTVHAAKGLEFAVVFVVGLEKGIFPHERSLAERGDDSEERRLFYVAITRAKQHLVLTWAHQRLRFGELQNSRPSDFISDIPEQLVAPTNINDMFRPATQDEQLNHLAELMRRLRSD